MIVKEQLWQIKLNLDVKDRRQSNSDCVAIEKEDIFCNVVKLGYGKGKNNPVDLTTFYKPNKQRDDGESVLGKRKSNGFSQEHLLNDINDGIDVGVVPQGK